MSQSEMDWTGLSDVGLETRPQPGNTGRSHRIPTALLSICINNTNSAHMGPGFRILRLFLYHLYSDHHTDFLALPGKQHLGFDNKLYDQADYHSLDTSEMGGLMSVSWMRHLKA